MTATVLEPPAPDVDHAPEQPELAHLEDRVPPHLKLSRRAAGCVVGFGLIFAWFVLKPLWHTDLWGHLAYGRHLAATGSLPSTEPLMVLSRGMPFVDTAWLCQLLGYGVFQSLGVAGLQGLASLTITATCIVLFHRVQQRTRSTLLAWLGVGIFLALDWGHLGVVRPQLAGLFCFVVLLHRLTSRQPSRWDWLVVPGLHALWANLHGSFVVGLALTGVFLLGRAIDLLRRTGRWTSLLHDQTVRRLLLWLQLSAAATLLNPYGLGLYAEVLTLADNPNLQALTEWQALNFRALHGLAFAGSAVALTLLYRWTPRRVASWEGLSLVGIALATFWSARFSVWWGPIAALALMMQFHAVGRRWLPWRADLEPSPTNGKWSVVCVGMAWIFFAYSPLGMRILHQREPLLEKAVSAGTPLGVVEWLKKHPPQGLVFNPYEWGDYLQWAGPTGMQVFLNSHAHLVPRDVWLHYLQIAEQSADWAETLDRYGVNTVILDKEYREGLIRRLKEDPNWNVGYEDNRGAVFVRRRAI